jgi:hypothetical protein
MTIQHLLRANALAERIGVTEQCLAKWRLTGDGPRFIRVQRRIAYDPVDVRQWLDARRFKSTSAGAA